MFVVLQAVSEEKYDVKMCVEEAGVIITAEAEPNTTCAVTLTSPIMREDNQLDAGKVKLPKTFQLCGSLLVRLYVNVTEICYYVYGAEVVPSQVRCCCEIRSH